MLLQWHKKLVDIISFRVFDHNNKKTEIIYVVTVFPFLSLVLGKVYVRDFF